MEAVVYKDELSVRLSMIKKANEELTELINICNDEDIDKQKLDRRIKERTKKIKMWTAILPECDPSEKVAFSNVESINFNPKKFDRVKYCK